jgi:malonyl-CoA decarboxylase
MRAELLTIIRTDPSLARLDVSFRALLRNWFSPSFLVLRPIDWSTPANILEKIIAYEAVHEIESWDDLRSRLAPDDRRCFAFFHPSMEDEPLIFVEVALTSKIPGQINEVLETDRPMIDATDASCAIFYSISNCQKGLAGISFGNFLIKQVAQALQREYPNLKNFLTLSPAPYFSKWLEKTEPNSLASFAEIDWSEASEEEEQTLIEAAGRYFMHSTRKDKLPNDPVARFHLGNGALLDRINLAGNLSQKGLSESFGLMVNYRYDLPNVEKNHEAYAKEQKIEISQDVKKLLKTP